MSLFSLFQHKNVEFPPFCCFALSCQHTRCRKRFKTWKSTKQMVFACSKPKHPHVCFHLRLLNSCNCFDTQTVRVRQHQPRCSSVSSGEIQIKVRTKEDIYSVVEHGKVRATHSQELNWTGIENEELLNGNVWAFGWIWFVLKNCQTKNNSSLKRQISFVQRFMCISHSLITFWSLYSIIKCIIFLLKYSRWAS